MRHLKYIKYHVTNIWRLEQRMSEVRKGTSRNTENENKRLLQKIYILTRTLYKGTIFECDKITLLRPAFVWGPRCTSF
jgi:sialic acid synthase SpsE